jgi:hypothetical protein
MRHAVQPKNPNTFQHASRPEWGAAIIAWEREGKRGYQFEDGQLRVFTSGHYHLLDSVELEPDRMKVLLAILGRPVTPVFESALPPPPAVRLTLEEQIEQFRRAYPGGFEGDAWKQENRGTPTGRSRKRHRDPAIAFAREELTAAKVSSWMEGRREQQGMATLAGVLGRTDLLPQARAQQLTELSPDRARSVAVALFDLLYARSGVEVRLMQWVQCLTRATGQAPNWSMATVPLALAEPSRFVCVHRTSFMNQAAGLGTRLELAPLPSGYAYRPVLALVEQIRTRLCEAGCAPADCFDVYDFICLTVSGVKTGAPRQR